MAISEWDRNLAGLRGGEQRTVHWHVQERRTGMVGLALGGWKTLAGIYPSERNAEWVSRAWGGSYRILECSGCEDTTQPDAAHFHVTVQAHSPNGRPLPLPFAFRDLTAAENFKAHTQVGGAVVGMVVCSAGRAGTISGPSPWKALSRWTRRWRTFSLSVKAHGSSESINFGRIDHGNGD